MTKKAGRDPGAPKRNLSAYLLYQNAMRDHFKATNPGMTFGQLSKYTSAMYAEMPPTEKQTWIQHAEQDKDRYLQELSKYDPPPGYDSKGDVVLSPNGDFLGKKKHGKPKRDKNAPKRNVSAYLQYQNAMREVFRKNYPGMTFGQLATYTSSMYKTLSVKEKAIWQTKAAQDKARFEAEMATYVPAPNHDAKGNRIESYNKAVLKRMKKQRDANAPKRARGSFVFFTFDMRPQIMKEFPNIKFIEMGVIMGERWRALPPLEKKRYEEMSTRDKERFSNEMKEYTAKKIALGKQVSKSARKAYSNPNVKTGYQQPYVAPPQMQQVHPQNIPQEANSMGFIPTNYSQHQLTHPYGIQNQFPQKTA